MNTTERISKIKTWLMVFEPFFGQMLLLSIKENNKECQTIGVNNKGDLLYNSEFISKLTDKQLLFVIAHEALHLAFMHPFRIGTKNPEIWNIAADIKVNYELINRSKKLGDPLEKGLIPELYSNGSIEILEKTIDNIKDKTSEDIYDELIKILKDKNKIEKVKIIKDLIIDDTITGSEKSAIENSIKAKIFEIKQRSKGNIPEGLENEFSAMMTPKIKWSFVIQHRIRSMTKNKTWKTPNKRYLPCYFPSKTNNKTAKIVFAIDTSGSMSEDEINEALSEIVGYANTFKAFEFYIIPCDCKEQEPIKINQSNKNKLKNGITLLGRGGTDYEPILNVIKKKWNNDIDMLVYFTDLECHFPDRPPYQVYWITRSKNKEVPFGRVINL